MRSASIDCIVIGYNEPPIADYAALLAKYGKNSEAYRDLRLSIVEVDGRPLDFVGLFNHAYALAHPGFTAGDDFMPLRSGEMPNLAAAYLTHFLRRRFSASYINLFQSEKEQFRQLLARGVGCVAITTTFYVLDSPVIEMIEFIRRHDPEVTIILGGPMVANYRRRYPGEDLLIGLEQLGADVYVTDAQGEITLGRVVEAVKNGWPLADVPNIVYRDGASLRMTPPVPENNSLDENWIDWTQLNDHILGPTLQARTARSCAFACAFCAYPVRAGALTLAEIDTVVRELESMAAVGGVRNVVFIDDTFNVPLKRFKTLCARMIERGVSFDWYSYFRCSHADEEAVELAARSGCKGVFLGVESASDEILRNMNKVATAESYRRGIEMLKRHGILTFGSFIAGYPGETRATFRESVDFIRQTALDYYRIQLWYCEPGTPIVNQRGLWAIAGDGFRWRHKSMTSEEAMALIEAAFQEITESVWLPQWSFDFWIIPYLRGRGISSAAFRRFMAGATAILSDQIRMPRSQQRPVSEHELRALGEALEDVDLGVGDARRASPHRVPVSRSLSPTAD